MKILFVYTLPLMTKLANHLERILTVAVKNDIESTPFWSQNFLNIYQGCLYHLTYWVRNYFDLAAFASPWSPQLRELWAEAIEAFSHVCHVELLLLREVFRRCTSVVVSTLKYTSDLLSWPIFSGGIQFEIPCLGILIRHITRSQVSNYGHTTQQKRKETFLTFSDFFSADFPFPVHDWVSPHIEYHGSTGKILYSIAATRVLFVLLLSVNLSTSLTEKSISNKVQNTQKMHGILSLNSRRGVGSDSFASLKCQWSFACQFAPHCWQLNSVRM